MKQNETKNLTKNLGKTLWALRKERHIRQCDLAENIGMPASQLCKLEKGISIPSIETLLKIAQELNVKLDELLSACEGRSPEAPQTELVKKVSAVRNPKVQQDDFEQFFRCTVEGKTGELPANCYRKLVKRVEEYKKLEQRCGVSMRATIPLYLPSGLGDTDAEALASRLRTQLGIGSAVVFDYVELFENHGLHIFLEELTENVRSLSFFDLENENLFIFIEKSLNPEKQLFLLLFEIGVNYLFTKRKKIPVALTHQLRHFAKHFAATFLMPQDAILATTARLGIGRSQWNYDLLVSLKSRYSVSAEAFAIRLMELSALEEHLGEDILAEIRHFYKENHFREPGDRLPALTVGARLRDLNHIFTLIENNNPETNE